MSITLLNVSWKVEELLNIALLLVQNLFYLPSLNLKIGLGLGFVFPFFVFYPVPGICPWEVLVKDILCQLLLLAHSYLEWHPEKHILHSPSSPSPGVSLEWPGKVCVFSLLWIWLEKVACAIQSVTLSLSPIWGAEFVSFPGKLMYRDVNSLLSPGHFVWLYQAQRSCNSDLTSKICFRGCIFPWSKVPTCSLLMFLEIWSFS